MSDIDETFFVTLMSNSSSFLFPHNSPSTFTNKLPKRFEFNNEMEVALIELHFPFALCNMYNKISRAWLMRGDKIIYRCIIDDDHIGDIRYVLSKLEEDFHENYEFNLIGERVVISNITSELLTLRFTKTLAMQLGFPTGLEFSEKEIRAPSKPNLNIGLPSHAFVYCDIVNPQIVGDQLSQILRSITIETRNYMHGGQGYITFPHAQYIPLSVNTLDQISINITDSTGKMLPFISGTSSALLHFRKRSE